MGHESLTNTLAPTCAGGASGPRQTLPHIWVLTDCRPRCRWQGSALSEKLGWPYEVKDLNFTRLDRLSYRLLGPTRASLDRARSSPLVPPWPDLVISTCHSTVPIARWIRKQGRGRTRVVQLNRKGGYVAKYFDLVVSLAHHRHPPNVRRIELMLPLHRASPERLSAAAERWPNLLGATPKPHVVLLVGGTTNDYLLDAQVAGRLVKDVKARVEASNGTLYVLNSPRTGATASEALQNGLGTTARFHQWGHHEGDSPYLAYLALTDILVVTCDSESMLAEAAATGKPLYIYSLPRRRRGRKRRFELWVMAQASGEVGDKSHWHWVARLFAQSCLPLFRLGLLHAPRYMSMLHDTLVLNSVARNFGGPLESRPWWAAVHEEDIVVRRIQELMGWK